MVSSGKKKLHLLPEAFCWLEERPRIILQCSKAHIEEFRVDEWHMFSFMNTSE